MKKHSIFWGIITLGGGTLLLLHALGIGTSYDLVPMLGSILLAAISIVSFIDLNFIMGLLPVAGITYLWRGELGLPEMNIWLILLAALLLGIGLQSIFWKFRKARFAGRHHHNPNIEWSSDAHVSSTTTTDDNDYVNVDSTFGEHIKYVRSTNLKKVKVDANFASIKVYFDQCQVSPDGAEIFVDCNFAGVVLYVPRSWNIDNQMHVFAGSVDGISLMSNESTRITLTGDVHFGEVKINYL